MLARRKYRTGLRKPSIAGSRAQVHLGTARTVSWKLPGLDRSAERFSIAHIFGRLP